MIKQPQILEKLKVIIKPYATNNIAFENFSLQTDFITDLNINSANLVDVILDIEEVFDIVIDNEDMQKMIDVNSTLAIIENKLAKK